MGVLAIVRVDKRELILKEAIQLFGKQGFYKTTTAQVAKAAGVTQPYIFHFFDSKEQLFNAVLDQAASRIKKAFESAAGNPDVIVGRMGQLFTAVMSEHRDEVLMVMQAYTIPEPAIRDHIIEIYSDIQNIILSKLLEAKIPDAHTETARFMAIGQYLVVTEVLGAANMFAIK